MAAVTEEEEEMRLVELEMGEVREREVGFGGLFGVHLSFS